MEVDETSYFPITAYKTFDMGDPNVILSKLKEFNEKIGSQKLENSVLDQAITICTTNFGNSDSINILFKLLDWPEGTL